MSQRLVEQHDKVNPTNKKWYKLGSVFFSPLVTEKGERERAKLKNTSGTRKHRK